MLGSGDRLSVAEPDAADDLDETLGAVQTAPVALGRPGELEDHRERSLAGQAALGLVGPQTHGRERALDRVGGADVLPVLGGTS